jgi:tetratricopeptide (TPR) repeat protein
MSSVGSVQRDEFEVWIASTRERFAREDECPLIDERAYDHDLISSAYSDAVDNDAVYEYLESLLVWDRCDIAVRFVILKYYYGLVHFDPFPLGEEFVAIPRARFATELNHFLGLRDRDHPQDFKTLRWEILNACAVRNFELARGVYEDLPKSRTLTDADLHQVMGRFFFLVAFLDDDGPPLQVWEPSPGCNLFLQIQLTFLVLTTDPVPAGRSTEWVRDAANALEKARGKNPQLLPVYRFMLARCYLAVGDFGKAAAEYQSLLDRGWDVPFGDAGFFCLDRADVRFLLYKQLVTAHQGCDVAGAVASAERWLEEFPERPEPRKRLAELQHEQGNDTAAIENLLEGYALAPAPEGDWMATLMINLGTRAAGADRVIEAVERRLDQKPELQAFLESVIATYWPACESLSPEARKSWIAATELLLDPISRDRLGEEVWWLGGFASAKALELELKAKVFAPFSGFVRGDEEHLRVARAAAGRDKLGAFAKYLVGQGRPAALPLQLEYLKWTLDPRHSLIWLFHRWLNEKHRLLVDAVAAVGEQELYEIGELRNAGTHESLSRSQADGLYAAVRELLAAVVCPDPSQF